jgi:hypothetical protein
MNNNDAPAEEAYICYKRVIDEIAVETQASCEKAHRAYAAAVRDACASEAGEQLMETAFRNYMKALLEAWAAEETQQRTEKAHQDFQLALQSSNATDIQEKRYRYERALEEAVSPEVAARCSSAHRDYVQVLKTARTAVPF